MRIVMIGPFGLQPLGTMRVRALPLARALTSRGHAVHMLLPPWQNPEDAGRVWEDAGVRIENMYLPAKIPGWFHVQLTAALVRRARTLHPEVVHVFKPKAYAGFAHMVLKKRFPVVLDTDDWEGPGGWNELNPYPPLLKRIFTWQERWGIKHADAVTAASRALQTLAWAMGGPAEKVFYLPNGVVPWPVASEQKASAARPVLLLYTRFFEYDLARLWRILLKIRAQEPSVQVLVVGKGFFGEEGQLLALAQEAGWYTAEGTQLSPAEDLLYAGWGTPDTLPGYFARADVALYPFDDTLVNRTKCPVKLLELLAAGIPVVGDAVGQLSEAIVHGKSGYLVSPGDEDAFASAVLSLLKDPTRRQKMAACAASDMRTRFSWAQQATIAEQAYAYARTHW